MFMTRWINELQQNLFLTDLLYFSPELVLCGGIILMLLMRLFKACDRLHMSIVALAATLIALAISVGHWSTVYQDPIHWQEVPVSRAETLFSGMLVFDNFTTYLRLFLFSFTALVIWLTRLTRIPDGEDSADFYTLLLGATIGMSIMASANHLLMVYMGVEMASLPSYALAGFLKGKRQSSEAALKYVVYGGGASGIMLYGISLLAGRFGTAYLPDLALGYAGLLNTAPTGVAVGFDAVILLGTLFILIGIGFKLAAVPFHFWCPDVFEGAAAEVGAFLSVASKGAALALLGRFTMIIAGLAGASSPDLATWLQMAQLIGPGIAIFAAVTATFGNLAAYVQTNLKRLLAYSTIAHAGYMMMGLATMMPDGVSSVLFYLIPYLFMNLGAFAIVAFLRNQTGSEDLSAFRGLIQRSPIIVIALAFCLFSLIGLPPLAGFAAKFQVFRALFDAGNHYSEKAPALSATLYALLLVGGLNTVFSLVYYVRVLKVMCIDKPVEEADGGQAVPLRMPLGVTAYSMLMAAIIFLLGIAWDPLARASDHGINRFWNVRAVQSRPAPPSQAEIIEMEEKRIGQAMEKAGKMGGKASIKGKNK